MTFAPGFRTDVDALKEVLGGLYGLDIQYFVEVNFEGFKKVVDAMGGVTVNVNVPVNFTDEELKHQKMFRRIETMIGGVFRQLVYKVADVVQERRRAVGLRHRNPATIAQPIAPLR